VEANLVALEASLGTLECNLVRARSGNEALKQLLKHEFAVMSRGRIEVLPSGALRVSVYAGLNPLTKQRHYLREVVPAGPRAAKEAEKVRTRLLGEIDDRRNPRTSATVNQLLDRYLGVLEIEDTTRAGYESIIRNYIRPLRGHLSIARVDGETLDVFTPSSDGAARAAAADPALTTERAPSISAIHAAPRTSAGRSARPTSGRSTPS